jgi:hypothetical protein
MPTSDHSLRVLQGLLDGQRDMSYLPVGDSSLIYAYVFFLSYEEISDLLGDASLVKKLPLRKGIIKRIAWDVEHGNITDAFTLGQAIERVIAFFETADGNTRRSIGALMTALLETLPSPQDIDLILNFVLSTDKPIFIRERGPKYLLKSQELVPRYLDQVIDLWEAHRDYQCARLLAECAPVEWLKPNYIFLATTLSGRSGYPRLNVRACEGEPQIAEWLRANDIVSYLYVCAKLGVKVSEDEARGALEEAHASYFGNRVGLVIWCLARLGLKEVLDHYRSSEDHYLTIWEQARLRESWVFSRRE